MGSAASTLTPEQGAQLTHKLKEKYAEYQKENLNDEEIRARISEEYSKLVEGVQAHGTKEGEHAKPVGLQKFNGKAGQKGKASTRRRSFDSSASSGKAKPPAASKDVANSSEGSSKLATRRRSDPHVNSTTEIEPPAQLVQSESISNVTAEPSAHATTSPIKPVSHPPAHEAVDSWDSVTQQPYCAICQMAFKSEAFLERHLKFSDLHVKNLMKRDEEGKAPETPIILPVEVARKQIEGEDFKMLYTGSKLFWRTQDNIDLHFYHHMLPHAIEIISYDGVKSKELNRLYLDYSILFDNLMATNQDFQDGNDEVRRTILTTYILQHLQLQSVTGITSMIYAKLAGDDHMKSPVLVKAPIVLVPVVVTRRRRTNAEEIEATMHNLDVDRAALAQATEKAERIALLVYSTVNLLSSQKWYSHLNSVRQRWIRAIRMVIRQKHVADTRKFLAAREKTLKTQKRTNIKANEI